MAMKPGGRNVTNGSRRSKKEPVGHTRECKMRSQVRRKENKESGGDIAWWAITTS
jgi:hypothetical protein